MRKVKLLLFIVFFAVSFTSAGAQDAGKQSMTSAESKSDKVNVNIGPGMEAITVDGTSILVPKDMIVTKEKGLITKEDIGAYLGRKFDEIGNRFDKIESGQEELKNEVEQLKQRVEALERNERKINNK